ncbi:MAG: hypothetical protein ACUVX8_02205 [Candidatus Zipacnadales bacterium]
MLSFAVSPRSNPELTLQEALATYSYIGYGHFGLFTSWVKSHEVFAAGGDSRLKCPLEVGQFHTVGISWSEAYDALVGRFELVHIKDQTGSLPPTVH